MPRLGSRVRVSFSALRITKTVVLFYLYRFPSASHTGAAAGSTPLSSIVDNASATTNFISSIAEVASSTTDFVSSISEMLSANTYFISAFTEVASAIPNFVSAITEVASAVADFVSTTTEMASTTTYLSATIAFSLTATAETASAIDVGVSKEPLLRASWLGAPAACWAADVGASFFLAGRTYP